MSDYLILLVYITIIIINVIGAFQSIKTLIFWKKIDTVKIKVLSIIYILFAAIYIMLWIKLNAYEPGWGGLGFFLYYILPWTGMITIVSIWEIALVKNRVKKKK